MMEIKKIEFNHILDLRKKSNTVLAQVNDIIVLDNEYLIDRSLLSLYRMPPFYIDARTYLLIIAGEITLNLNYKTYRLKKGTLIRINGKQVIDKIYPGENYKAYSLILSHEFFLSIINWVPELKDMIICGSYFKQMVTFNDIELCKYVDIIEELKKRLRATDHKFQKQIVKIETARFILELTDSFVAEMLNEKEGMKHINYREETMRRFMSLVLTHCKMQREVSYYANQMNMTPGNFSRVITHVSGRSPAKWIILSIIVEAKTLLRTPDMNVQQVSDELNFGDQSSFGKFFKKHTGLTPVAYKHAIRQDKLF